MPAYSPGGLLIAFAWPLHYKSITASNVGNSNETARVNGEEGGDDVKSSRPLRPGLHTCYNGRYNGQLHSDVMLISKNRSQFGLKSATRLHEAGFASNRASAMAR